MVSSRVKPIAPMSQSHSKEFWLASSPLVSVSWARRGDLPNSELTPVWWRGGWGVGAQGWDGASTSLFPKAPTLLSSTWRSPACSDVPRCTTCVHATLQGARMRCQASPILLEERTNNFGWCAFSQPHNHPTQQSYSLCKAHCTQVGAVCGWRAGNPHDWRICPSNCGFPYAPVIGKRVRGTKDDPRTEDNMLVDWLEGSRILLKQRQT